MNHRVMNKTEEIRITSAAGSSKRLDPVGSLLKKTRRGDCLGLAAVRPVASKPGQEAAVTAHHASCRIRTKKGNTRVSNIGGTWTASHSRRRGSRTAGIPTRGRSTPQESIPSFFFCFPVLRLCLESCARGVQTGNVRSPWAG